jgi:tRNA pseudouridine synthase 10
MGSEDKESLVLGNGRPFFAKLISPKKSDVLLPKKFHQDEIVIHDLRKIDHIPKGTIPFKSKITLLIETKNKITSEKLKELKHLDDVPIIVTDERGIRHKKIIYNLKYKKESARSFFVMLEADGGLPIKRFVEGANVDPSISKILDTKCSCRQFDINQILP